MQDILSRSFLGSGVDMALGLFCLGVTQQGWA